MQSMFQYDKKHFKSVAKGELELSVYNDKLNIACKVSEMSEYVKQPYNPNN